MQKSFYLVYGRAEKRRSVFLFYLDEAITTKWKYNFSREICQCTRQTEALSPLLRF